jgi:hypothetical protein
MYAQHAVVQRVADDLQEPLVDSFDGGEELSVGEAVECVEVGFVLYPVRFYVLFAFMVTSFNQCLFWITYSPITQNTQVGNW